MKKWVVLNKLKSKNEKVKIDEVIETLLINRGIKAKKQIEEFLNPPNPYTLTPNRLGVDPQEVKKAVKRIKKAIKHNEKIIVYGDYDTDGVCATAILWETLHKLGAKVMPFIPRREEGYGMKVEKIEEFKKEGVGLIITVDQGIVAVPQVEHAQKLGIDVIITDHHLPGKKKPPALAIVHTTKLSGSGVSWFLSSRLGKPGLDLVTIGTVADVMPLLGPNRAIVKHGLEEVRETKRPGFLALYQAAGIVKEKIGIYEISFMIAPRLNAAGRMGDPMESLRLVCTPDEQRAISLAQKIDEQNRQRQLLTTQTTLHARNLWLAEDGKSNLIFVSHESWEEGIVGLVAGKLLEEFYRPAVIVSRGEKYSRASARSVNGFNIVEALRTCADILGSHGGHALAAGFTVETVKLKELKTRLSRLAEEELDKEKLTPVLKIDLEIELSDLTVSLYHQAIKKMAPFGEKNPEPLFLSRNLSVAEARLVGKDSRHLKLRLTSPSSRLVFEAIAFGMGNGLVGLEVGQKVDAVYTLNEDEWNGEKRLQLKVKDLRINDGS